MLPLLMGLLILHKHIVVVEIFVRGSVQYKRPLGLSIPFSFQYLPTPRRLRPRNRTSQVTMKEGLPSKTL
ncbi:hypothetical protein ZWY2020_002082 [Hordeum vulgare]|nr:hypothetical protein ZWY2020_002082 [Hordeum vulgare]